MSLGCQHQAVKNSGAEKIIWRISKTPPSNFYEICGNKWWGSGTVTPTGEIASHLEIGRDMLAALVHEYTGGCAPINAVLQVAIGGDGNGGFVRGWSRQRRIILLRRKLSRDLAMTDRADPAQPLLGFAEVGPDKELWEYAALVTSLDSEILTLGQLYRDRADCENVFDELTNQWGWGGFTTRDLTRCRLLAGVVALN